MQNTTPQPHLPASFVSSSGMESALLDMELRSLILSKLTQGKELAKQLETNLNTPSPSPEVCDVLVNKIIDSYNRILSMVNNSARPARCSGIDIDMIAFKQCPPRTDTPMLAVGISESPPSPSGSPGSQESDMESKFHDKKISDGSKKRKSMPRWTRKVEIHRGSVSEGPLDDGHNWRKYGQKDILGAKYPRSYYRCTQRHAQGCLATKQVQRTDENPTTFEITYRGVHTCSPRSSSKSASKSASASAPEKQQDKSNNIIDMHHQDQQALLVSNFETGMRVEIDPNDQHFPDDSSFNFPSTSSNNVLGVANYPFSPNCLIDEELANNFQNYYTNNLHVQVSDQELMEMTSTTTSGENSPNVNLDYPFSIFSPTFHIW